MEKYFDINENGYSIKCKLYCDKVREINNLVLFMHGFGGHKDNQAAAHFAESLLAKAKKTAVLTYDMPCHGTDVRKKLTMDDTYKYLDLVLDYIKNSMGINNIFLYSVSFGGFVAFNYIENNGNPFVKAAFRCPAVKMYDSLTAKILTDENKELLLKGKDILAGFDRKIKIDQAFLDEIENLSNKKLDLIDYADDFVIIQGSSDEIVSVDTVKAFAEDNVIDLVLVDKADHRFKDIDKLKYAHSLITNFFLSDMK